MAMLSHRDWEDKSGNNTDDTCWAVIQVRPDVASDMHRRGWSESSVQMSLLL
jgi:hypothetical protein